MCTAVLVKTKVCGGCSVSLAHKTSFRLILFPICLREMTKRGAVEVRGAGEGLFDHFYPAVNPYGTLRGKVRTADVKLT